MSNTALTWAFDLPMKLPAAKAVLIALANHADKEGRCWPAIPRLMLSTALARRTVIRALEALENLGHIQTIRSKGRGNHYQLSMNQCQSDTSVTETPGQCQSDTTPVSERHHTSVTVTPEPSRTLNEPSGEGVVTRARASETTIPPDWTAGPELIEWATKAHPIVEARHEVDRFRDYNLAHGTLRTDWNATFRGWIRTEAQWRVEHPARIDRVASRTDENRRRMDAALAAHNDQLNGGRAGKPALRLLDGSDS